MTCYFVDVDETLICRGTHVPIPGAIERNNQLYDEGHQVWLFTCWPATQQSVDKLKAMGIKFHGMIPKPVAEEYVYIDDRLNVSKCNTSMVQK